MQTGYTNFPKAFAKGGKAVFYYLKEEKELRAKIAESIKQQWGDRAPLKGDIDTVYFFGVPVPESWSKKKREQALNRRIKPSSKPDLSNFMYWLENRLKGIVIADDASVVDFAARERYTIEPRTEVYIRIIPPEED